MLPRSCKIIDNILDASGKYVKIVVVDKYRDFNKCTFLNRKIRCKGRGYLEGLLIPHKSKSVRKNHKSYI